MICLIAISIFFIILIIIMLLDFAGKEEECATIAAWSAFFFALTAFIISVGEILQILL